MGWYKFLGPEIKKKKKKGLLEANRASFVSMNRTTRKKTMSLS
jgi:hypothetical protein